MSIFDADIDWHRDLRRMHEEIRNTPYGYKPERWVTVHEAMRMLGLSKSAVETRLRDGRLDYFNFHPREPRYIRREDVEREMRVLDRRRNPPADPAPVV